MRDYVRRYFIEGSQPSKDGKIIIRDVTDRSFRTILFTFGRMAGGAALHVANRSYMQHAMKSMPHLANGPTTTIGYRGVGGLLVLLSKI